MTLTPTHFCTHTQQKVGCGFSVLSPNKAADVTTEHLWALEEKQPYATQNSGGDGGGVGAGAGVSAGVSVFY